MNSGQYIEIQDDRIFIQLYVMSIILYFLLSKYSFTLSKSQLTHIDHNIIHTNTNTARGTTIYTHNIAYYIPDNISV